MRVTMSTTCAVGRRQHAGVAGQQQAVRLVEVDVDVQLRQRPGHDLADGHLVRVASSCRTRASVTSWMLPTGLPSCSTGSCEMPGRLHQLDGLADGGVGGDRHQLPRRRAS